jgi:hypothetical protein
VMNIEIEIGIDMPPIHARTSAPSPLVESLSAMEVGDSFMVPVDLGITKVMGAIQNEIKPSRVLFGKKFSYRKVCRETHRFRVWRVK